MIADEIRNSNSAIFDSRFLQESFQHHGGGTGVARYLRKQREIKRAEAATSGSCAMGLSLVSVCEMVRFDPNTCAKNCDGGYSLRAADRRFRSKRALLIADTLNFKLF
jgi:hypothetical protein